VENVLTDLLGYYKRNIGNLKTYQIKKELSEIKQIEKLLQQKLKGGELR
jgi:hypothetical protein